MTKEQILNKRDLIYYMGSGEDEVEGSKEKVFEAMEEYARIRSIEYNRWVQTFENSSQARRFHNVETDEQLYELFSQQSLK